MRRTIAGTALFFGTIAAAPSAYAKMLDLRLDTNFHTQEGVTAASPVARVAVPLGDLTLRADWGVVIADVGEASSFKPLNPYLGVGYDIGIGVMNLSVGAGLAIPVLRFSETTDQATAASAAAMVGYWDNWLYRVDTLSVAFPARLDLNIPGIDAMVEGALYLFLDTGAASNEFGAQLAAEASFPLLPVLSLGARLQTVYLVTDGTFQTAAEPFVQVGAGPIAVRGGFLLNIDEPAGFAFDDGKFWSAHLGLRLAI